MKQTEVEVEVEVEVGDDWAAAVAPPCLEDGVLGNFEDISSFDLV